MENSKGDFIHGRARTSTDIFYSCKNHFNSIKNHGVFDTHAFLWIRIFENRYGFMGGWE